MPKKELPKPNKSGNLRGTNSRSHGNHNKGKVKQNLSLRPETLMRSRKLGFSASDGVDKGIDKLFVMLPVFLQAKTIIEMSIEHLPEDKVAIAEAVLLELEDLEIEALYKECETEGLIEPKSGAWII